MQLRFSHGIATVPTLPLVWLSIKIESSLAATCALYLAQSTIPEAGLGVFTGISRNPGDIIGAGDVCIPLLDPGLYHDNLFDPFDDYVWMGEDMGMKMEMESQVKAFCPVCPSFWVFIARKFRIDRCLLLCRPLGLGLRYQL